MSAERKKGFEITPTLHLFVSRGRCGGWTAWIERDGQPMEMLPGQAYVFEGNTQFQAQCRAIAWMRGQAPPELRPVLPRTLEEHWLHPARADGKPNRERRATSD